MVNLATLIAFWKRKEPPSAPEAQRIIPLPPLPGMPVETPRSTSQEAADKARDALKILRLEQQILGSAVTTIYESQAKGLISEAERDRMLEKYKVDVNRLEKAIGENQRVVDLFDLESERDKLIRNFRAKLVEMDARLRDLRSGTSPARTPLKQKSDQEEEKKSKVPENDKRKDRSNGEQAKEKKPSSQEEQQITEAEKRIEQIREEILKAMDRLEQIEAEG